MRFKAEQRALELGIHSPRNLSLRELVRAIQQAQGKQPCFLSDQRYQCEADCEWAEECRKLRAEWRR
jgi:hypothetical protein